MAQFQAFTGYQSAPDGGVNLVRGMRTGELAVGQVHGPYYESASRGVVYTASTVIAGVVIPTAAATLNSKFTLWNPATSGKVAEIISLYIGCDTVTTVAGNNGLLLQTNLANGAGIPTTVTTPCAAVSTGKAGVTSGMTVAAQATLTNVAIPGASGSAVPIPFIPLSNYGAVTSVSNYNPVYYFYGSLVVYPDSLIALCASVAPSTAAVCAIQWAEYPV
jgi:hypothetical protein